MHIEWAAISTLAVAVLVAIGKAQGAQNQAQDAQNQAQDAQNQAQAPEQSTDTSS